MNKKILTLIMSLIVVSMVAGPVVSVNGEKKDGLNFFNVRVPGWVDPPIKYNLWITDEGTLKEHYTKFCDIGEDNYVINIGGEIIGPDENDVWIFEGGNTYVLGQDFTYSGYHTSKKEWIWWYGWKWVYWKFTLYGTYDFTLSGIDGTLEFCLRVITYYSLYGEVIESRCVTNGYGTGELIGVTMKSTGGPLIYTPQTGIQWATDVGTIWGWPDPPL